MQELKNNIRAVTFLLPEVLDADTAVNVSEIIDTRELDTANSGSFDTALIVATIGTAGADITDIDIKIEESDSSTFVSGVTVAEGGAERAVVEESSNLFQIKRTKRYLRATVTLAEDGEADTVPVAITGILCNWSTPFPIV